MNNNITEDYCSYEVSKLLKEKGFDVDCQYSYDYEGNNFSSTDDNSTIKPSKLLYGYCSPTHALAIKWIRENFNIWISVDWTPLNNGDEIPFKVNWWYMISGEIGNPEKSIDSTELQIYSSSEEATEAALLYTLQNLIK